MEQEFTLEENLESGLYEALIEETPTKYVYGTFSSQKDYYKYLNNDSSILPIYTREIEKEGDHNLLWSLILNPEKGLPLYNYLVMNNKLNLITIISSTLLGTFNNSYLNYEQKKSALIAAITLLKNELIEENVYDNFKDIIQEILTLSSFSINLEEL